MNAALFASACLGIVWLAIWTALPKPYTKPTWWPWTWFPFDMIEDAVAKPGEEAPQQENASPSRRWRDPIPAPPQVSGATTTVAAPAVREPATPGWRQRAARGPSEPRRRG
jgi:hypothetical protein